MAKLYLRAESGRVFWQVWPKQDAIPAGEIREASSYIFELRDCNDALAADLLIEDVSVEALRSRHPHIACWRWNPGFHAGSVEVALRIPGTSVRRFEIITDPDLRKLTRADFDMMVREILQDTFALFSLSSFRKGIARQPGNRLPPLARLEFLRSRIDEIMETVASIAHSPRHFLRAEEITVPVHRAMRAAGPEIIKSFRSGALRIETVRPSRLPQTLGGCLPAQIKMRKHKNSLDIAEHRQMKACLKSWSTWIAGVAEVLTKTNKADNQENHTNATSWAVRANQIARKLNNIASSGFMMQVGDGTATLQMSSLFRNDPLYQRFYRLWQDMNLGLAALFGDFLQMPLARTYELYELWCFFRLLRAAAEEYSPASLNLSQLFKQDSNGEVTITASAVIVPVGADKTLCFQRQYREYWIEPAGEGSFTRTMIPDIVFSDTGFGDAERKMIVLDAKYRISAGLNEALNSIHTYRDALVHEDENGKVKSIVTAAYLLTPHLPDMESDFHATPVPGRLFHPQYREKFRFGAVTLRPGMTLDQLRTSLKTIVADASVQDGK